MRAWRIMLVISCCWVSQVLAEQKPLVVASKQFTESYVLAEIVTQLLNAEGIAAVHEQVFGWHVVYLHCLAE